MNNTSRILMMGASLAAAGTAAAIGGWTARRKAERRSVGTARRSADEVARAHADKVERIALELRQHGGGAVSLRKRAVPHEVPKRDHLKHRDGKLDVTALTEILHIDPERRICVAESGVTFEDLVAATLAHGLLPIVVPEFKSITIGGAVSGCSIESTSFRHGGFHDTCLEYEVITGTGEVLVCTPDNEHALVFQMMHGSFGTLGVLARLTFRLMPATAFVRVEYEKYATLDAYLAAIRGRFERQDVDFMDGIIHSPTEYVLCLGRFVAEAQYTNRYDWMKIYYASTREREEDYLRTEDYLFRYDRGVTNVWGRSLAMRALFGKLLGSTNVMWVARRFPWLVPRERPTVTLDVFVPISRAPEFLEWYAREFDHFPLWCVPYRRVRDYEWISPRWYAGFDDPLLLDLAVYGMKQRGDTNYYRLMEEELPRVNGIKTLISHNYYSESEFWDTWNRPNYARVKARTDPANVFRDLYDKTCRASRGLT